MLEIRGAAPGLLDDPLLLEVGGAAPNTKLTWRARLRDDDGFVWRAQADTPDGLLNAWVPAKASAGAVAALRSLRPVDVDVRVEDPDGAASSRTVTRTLSGDGVKVRRWSQGVTGRLYLPAGPPQATVIAATSDDDAVLAAALLASRGVRVFVVTHGDPDTVLSALPPAGGEPRRLDALPVAPGVPAREPGDGAAWDALLADLGAQPRRVAR